MRRAAGKGSKMCPRGSETFKVKSMPEGQKVTELNKATKQKPKGKQRSEGNDIRKVESRDLRPDFGFEVSMIGIFVDWD